jgi:UDP-N-acetylglucosamine 2-epimerase
MHPNPAIKVIADNYLLNNPKILLTQPLPFQQLHKIIADSWLIMTDSGGIQEEATILGKSIFVLRESTERSDIIKEINGILISPNKESLVREFDTFYNKNFSNITRQLKNDRIKNKGSVSEKIIKIIGENIIS